MAVTWLRGRPVPDVASPSSAIRCRGLPRSLRCGRQIDEIERLFEATGAEWAVPQPPPAMRKGGDGVEAVAPSSQAVKDRIAADRTRRPSIQPKSAATKQAVSKSAVSKSAVAKKTVAKTAAGKKAAGT